MSRHNPHVTEARREIILQAIVYLNCVLGRGASIREVYEQLQKWVDDGLAWPQADWTGARNEPYYVGTSQHMQAMRWAKRVEAKNGQYRSTEGEQLRARAAEALRLKSEGKNGAQIAEELGISKSLAYSLINDPTGAKEKERKRGYCPSCGAKKAPEAVACRKCRQIETEELLPPDSYRHYILQAREQGFELVFGVTPGLARVIRVDVGRGYFDYEVRSDLTWRDGLDEVGREIGVGFE